MGRLEVGSSVSFINYFISQASSVGTNNLKYVLVFKN